MALIRPFILADTANSLKFAKFDPKPALQPS